MLQTGRMNEVAEEILNKGIEVAALQEIRWKGEGQICTPKYTFYYSGEEKQGRNGVGFIVAKSIKYNIIEFKTICPRINYIRINTKPYVTAIINVYAPTENEKEDEKDIFYEEIERLLEKLPTQDTIIMMGDFNAQIGKENYISDVAGKHTIHTKTNDNGIRLCNAAMTNGLLIVSTKFEHKHKATWCAPNGQYKNQIDHVLVTKKRQSIIQDVKVCRETNIETDHYMVITKIKTKKLSTQPQQERKAKWKVEELTNLLARQKYEQEMSNEILKRVPEGNVEEKWKRLRTVIDTAAKKTIGFETKKREKEWWNMTCQRTVISKIEAWKRYQATAIRKITMRI